MMSCARSTMNLNKAAVKVRLGTLLDTKDLWNAVVDEN